MDQNIKKVNDHPIKVCVPIVEKDTDLILEHCEKIVEAKADWIEWRIDFFANILDRTNVHSTIKKLRSIAKDIPILLTYRTSQEGGQRDFEQDLYVSLYQELIDLHLVDVVDFEAALPSEIIDPLLNLARKNKVQTILSYHNFEKTSSKGTLLTLLNTMALRGSDYLKLAVMPQTQEDVYTLMDVCHEASLLYPSKKLIAMSMGELGKISRICGEYFGSCLTFASLGSQSAPGQIEIHLLKECLSCFHDVLKKGDQDD